MNDVLFRAAGWLEEPAGESRASTIELIKALVAEIKRLEATCQRYSEAMEEDSLSPASGQELAEDRDQDISGLWSDDDE